MKEDSQFRSDLMSFIVRTLILLMLPEFHDIFVHLGFKVKEGDEFIEISPSRLVS